MGLLDNLDPQQLFGLLGDIGRNMGGGTGMSMPAQPLPQSYDSIMNPPRDPFAVPPRQNFGDASQASPYDTGMFGPMPGGAGGATPPAAPANVFGSRWPAAPMAPDPNGIATGAQAAGIPNAMWPQAQANMGGLNPDAGALPPNATPAQLQQQPMNAQQPGMPQQGQPTPDFGSRLNAGLQGFANSRGVLPAIGNLIGGLQTGQRQDSGARPQLQKTGTDPLTGQDTFAWVNPQTQTMTPATMSGAPAAGLGGSMQKFADAVRSGVSGEELYKTLPPGMENTIRAMIEGRRPAPTGAGLRSPQALALIEAAHSIDPTFDETAWGARAAQRKNYEGGGKQYQELQAIGTVAGHLKNFMPAIDDLKNGDYPILNGVKNWYLSNTGDPRVKNFNVLKQAVTMELGKAYAGGHLTEGQLKNWQSGLDNADSPDQLKTVVGQLNDLLMSKRQTLEEGYRQTMGKNTPPAEFSSVNERTRKIFDDLAAWSHGIKPAGAGTGGAAPDPLGIR